MSLEQSEQELRSGDAAPHFELLGADGETYTLNDFSGYDALLIVFTCNHCPYAKAKIPALNAIAAEYGAVAVVGINPNSAESHPEDSFDRMQDLVTDGTIRYDAYLRDESQDVARSYGAVCTPDSFLFVQEDGEWVLAYHGRLDDALNPDDEPSEEPGFEMRDVIDALLAGSAGGEEFKPSQGCSIKWKD